MRLTGYDDEVDDLACKAHDTIYATDEERRIAREADGTVKDVLVVLNDCDATELGQGLDKADEAQPFDVLLPEQHHKVTIPLVATNCLEAPV